MSEDGVFFVLVWAIVAALIAFTVFEVSNVSLEWQKYDASIRLTCVSSGGIYDSNHGKCMWSRQE